MSCSSRTSFSDSQESAKVDWNVPLRLSAPVDLRVDLYVAERVFLNALHQFHDFQLSWPSESRPWRFSVHGQPCLQRRLLQKLRLEKLDAPVSSSRIDCRNGKLLPSAMHFNWDPAKLTSTREDARAEQTTLRKSIVSKAVQPGVAQVRGQEVRIHTQRKKRRAGTDQGQLAKYQDSGLSRYQLFA